MAVGEHANALVGRHERAELLIAAGPQPWGYAGAFTDPDGHVWMVTSRTPD